MYRGLASPPKLPKRPNTRKYEVIKMSFSDLKKQSKLGSLTSKLVKEVEKMNTASGSSGDDRFWKPEMDKTGVGSAVIRFLPAPEGEDMPWVKMWSHAFQGPGGWYIENSLTTIGKKDPVGEYNRELWNSGDQKKKEIVSLKQKRKLSYYANIYVVRDPLHPENEGKVFLYKFGKKIFDKILNAMQPEFDDEEPINPFDFWQGANFKLKIVKKDGYWNYDKSDFDRVSPLLDDDDALEAIWKKEYSLAEIIAPDKFKTYEELEKRMNSVLNLRSAVEAVRNEEKSFEQFKPSSSTSEDDVMAELEDSYRKSKETTSSESGFNDPDITPRKSDEDDPLSFFEGLVNS